MNASDVRPETIIDAEAERRIRAFLYEEARLADAARYNDWLDLWAPGEISYWVAPSEDTDPQAQVSLIFDNRERVEQRVARWASGFAWAQVPRSLTNRIVGNVEVLEASDESVKVRANVHIAVSRRAESSQVIGHAIYRLVSHDNRYLMSEKRVVLLDGDVPVGNITFVL